MVDEEALKVLYRLHRHGFLSCLVGGSVRDLLLGKVPKDFDVATNAHPHEIHALFKNSRIIGRRFRLVHVFFKGGKVVEVSTFRSHSEFEETLTDDGEILKTDSFGTPQEDALRRDITINGLLYNIADFSIIDYVGGIADLQKKMIRTIGDPDEKFKQDPVRMIRVIRHATRTGFHIEEKTYQAILNHREEIRKCSPSRVRDEFLRELKEGVAKPSLSLMLQTSLLLSLFPNLDRIFGDRNPFKDRDRQLFLSLFGLVDELVKMDRLIPESIFFALFLTPILQVLTPDHPFLGEREQHLYRTQTTRLITREILTPFSIPKATKEIAYQALVAQSYLRKAINRGMIPKRMRMKKYFKEAVLLFGLEAQVKGEKVPRMIQNAAPSGLLPWWPKEEFKRRRRRFKKRPPFTSLIPKEGKEQVVETKTTRQRRR